MSATSRHALRAASVAERPRVWVSQPLFDDIVSRLHMHFDVVQAPDVREHDAAAIAAALREVDGALVTLNERIGEREIANAPKLRAVANVGVGYDNLDVRALQARGIIATNTPDVLTETTADFGFALMMAAARRITESERHLRGGKWTGWNFKGLLGADLHRSTLGILGMGRIGQGIARRGAHGFGMNVIYHNRSRLAPDLEAACKARYVDKEELLRTADHLVLVLPYSKESHHAIGAAELRQMKPTATLVNIARGGIVDDGALAQALRDKTIAAAGIDVFEGEPHVHPDLLTVPNVVLTPHIASATVPTRMAMAKLAADNLIGFLVNGKPLTPINPEVLK